MPELLQQLANGTTKGATYALVALGYTMVYGIIQLINFAHGDVFMVGAFAGLFFITYVLPHTGLAVGTYAVSLPLTFVFAMAVCASLGVILERFAYRPLRNAPRLAPLITALGASIVLEQSVRNFYPGGTRQPRFPPRGSLFPEGFFSFYNNRLRVPYLWMFIVAVAVVMMIGLLTFIGRTRLGKAMRASAQDRDAARLMGIDIDRIIMITFIIGSSLAAIGGVLTGMYQRQVDFFMGFGAGLKAFTAAVLGGIGNIRGAMFGGFLLGMVESLAVAYAYPRFMRGQSWQDVWAFVVLVLVLVFRPTGLFGERVAV